MSEANKLRLLELAIESGAPTAHALAWAREFEHYITDWQNAFGTSEESAPSESQTSA